MTLVDLIALGPFIVLTLLILVVLMQVSFARGLLLTTLLSCVGLLLTLAVIVFVSTGMSLPRMVTPLLIVDAYALLFSGLIVIGALFVCLLAYSYYDGRGEQQDEFMVLMLLATLGGITLAHSAHFGSFVLGLELVGVSLYAMISYPAKGLFSVEAALKYLILSGVSSALILFGVALLFAMTGTLAFEEMGRAEIRSDGLFLLVGFALIVTGIGFKLSLVPFHMWTPDVYEGAPAPATAFLATVSKGGIFAALLRFFVSFEGVHLESIIECFYWFAVLSILFGNLLALMQPGVKRLLAYSSVAHLGYLLVAVVAVAGTGGQQFAVEAALFFLVAYFMTTIGAFGVVSVMSSQSNDLQAEHDMDDMTAYRGLFWRRPLLAAFFSAMLLSLAGIPLTMGFIGKFYIFVAGVEAGLWYLLAVVVVGSGIGLFYYLRVIYTMALSAEDDTLIRIPAAGGWTLGAVSLVMVMLGVYPTPLVNWITVVAQSIG